MFDRSVLVNDMGAREQNKKKPDHGRKPTDMHVHEYIAGLTPNVSAFNVNGVTKRLSAT